MDRFERVLPFMRRPERQWERRLTFRQRLTSVLVVPSVAFWDIVRELDNRGPLFIFFGNILAVSLFFVAMVVHVANAAALGLYFGFVGILLVYAVLAFIWAIVYFGIIHAVVRVSGREGVFAETFLLGQYSQLPLLITNAISLLLLLVGLPFNVRLDQMAFLTLSPVWLVVWALTISAWLWGAVLLALGLRERYNFSTGGALFLSLAVTVFAVAVWLVVRLTPTPIT
jgi:uncharacterized protein with PQ loop repeat